MLTGDTLNVFLNILQHPKDIWGIMNNCVVY